MAKIISATGCKDQIFELYNTGNRPGVKIGFSDLDEHYSVKLGSTTIIYGHPTVGKTQFLNQIIVSLIGKYEWKGVMYSPETGNASEIFSELIHAITGKTFDKRYSNCITEKELYNVLPYLDSMVKVIEPTDEGGLGFDEWLELSRKAKKDYGCTWYSADNWNDIDHNLHEGNGMISEYLKKQLPKFNRFAKIENMHGFIITHARNPQFVQGQKVPIMPRPDEIEGGSVWFAKAMNLIGLHREYEEVANGYMQSNELTIDIKKIKPKIVGKKGSVKITYDISQNCYRDRFGVYIETPFKEIVKPQNTITDEIPF